MLVVKIRSVPCGGIIFVVDLNEFPKHGRNSSTKMLNEDELQDALLLVFANKQDLLMVMNTVDITDKLGLHGYIGDCKYYTSELT